jgi:hypothetical protein
MSELKENDMEDSARDTWEEEDQILPPHYPCHELFDCGASIETLCIATLAR